MPDSGVTKLESSLTLLLQIALTALAVSLLGISWVLIQYLIRRASGGLSADCDLYAGHSTDKTLCSPGKCAICDKTNMNNKNNEAGSAASGSQGESQV